ncbi:hypothetical protein ACLKA7_001388 [Drosophila subpalustris]
MIDAACNYLDHFALSQPTSVLQQQQQQHQPQLTPQDHDQQQQQQATHDFINASNTCNSNASSLLTLYAKQTATASKETASTSHQVMPPMKMEMQYPPQASSTGSASPNSSTSQSAASSASVSPSIFPSPAQSLACIAASPLAAVGCSSASASASSSSASSSSSSSSAAVAAAAAAAADLGAAAVASAAYGWNTTTYTSLPTRTQFPYAQYATDYYGNVATVGVAASAASAAWFSHQERLYQPWSSQSYPTFNFDDIAFQTQLQRRSVRCTCPNCTNEMSGLPPIVGPDERGRKQHICHILGCERLYGKASHLKTHLRWHTGERPFLCLTCGKRFSRSDELQRHGRTHTNYRPYACSICSKKFSRSDHLSKHKKTHFKDKKTKKALVAEAKEQSAFIKLEKPDKTLLTNKKINSRSTAVATSMPVSGEQLKQEQPETPTNLGYAPYMNLQLQSGAAAATTATATATATAAATATAVSTDLALPLAPPPPLFQSQHQRDANRSRYEPWTNSSNTNNDLTEMNHNQTTSESIRPSLSVRSNQTQHYAALAMQSESQLATEYGLTMSGLASGASDSSSNSNSSSNHSNAGYASPIGLMKSEFAGSYPTEFANSPGYGYVHHHHHHHHAAHHHHQNAWAAAYHHPHTTA